MESKYILVAESGSDITRKLAEKYGIVIVPMHVSFGETTLDDGSFPIQKIFDHYETTGELPKTSACNPMDFEKVFDELHERYPEKHILHLAYSAVTTCSFQNALIAGENRPYVTSVDTENVSVGQGMIVMRTAEYLNDHPEAAITEVLAEVERLKKKIHMCFFPDTLVYLKAGGRVSNAAYLGAKVLNLKPMIEILEGKLISTQKKRGSMLFIAPRIVGKYAEQYNLSKEEIILLWSEGIDPAVKEKAEKAAVDYGFKSIKWMETGGVVSTHGGPGCFGIVAFSE